MDKKYKLVFAFDTPAEASAFLEAPGLDFLEVSAQLGNHEVTLSRFALYGLGRHLETAIICTFARLEKYCELRNKPASEKES
jgi:hypothetical protein